MAPSNSILKGLAMENNLSPAVPYSKIKDRTTLAIPNYPSFNISITDVIIELSISPFNLPTSEIIKLLFAVKSFPGRAKLVKGINTTEPLEGVAMLHPPQGDSNLLQGLLRLAELLH